MTMTHYYRRLHDAYEECYSIESTSPFTKEQTAVIEWLLSGTGEGSALTTTSTLTGALCEIGPRLSFATAFSTNAVSVCKNVGLDTVTRLELSRRYVLPRGQTPETFFAAHGDRMTEMIYTEPVASFVVPHTAQDDVEVPLLEAGVQALKKLAFKW